MSNMRYAFVAGELPVLKPVPGACGDSKFFVDFGHGGPRGQQPQVDKAGDDLFAQANVYRDIVPLLLAQIRRDKLDAQRLAPIFLGYKWDPMLGPVELQHLVLDVAEALVREGFSVRLKTRASLSHDALQRLGDLGSAFYVEMPFVSMRPDIAAQWEPGSASPGERLRSARALSSRGIAVEARLDPLLPLINDTMSDLEAFCVAFAGTDMLQVTASYLRLTPDLAKAISPLLSPMHRNVIKGCFAEQSWIQDGQGGSYKVLDDALRQRGLQRFLQVAQEHGLIANVCACTDGDVMSLTGRKAKRVAAQKPVEQSTGKRLMAAGQMTLF